MKILFVDSARYRPDGTVNRTGRAYIPAITLPLLAALTPRDIEVRIHLDLLAEPDYGWRPDVVAITGYTKSMARAYDIAARFRSGGAHVAMGGIHVSMVPEEAMERCDTVFVGEAEATWPRFVEDFRRGAPERLYKGDPTQPLTGWPVPRYDLLDPAQFYSLRRGGLLSRFIPVPAYPVETSRGCPHACSFCSVSPFLGTAYRVRPVPEVVAEIKALRVKCCLFVDNNFFGDHDRAKELLRALIPLKISWVSHATMASADDKELLELAQASGCRSITVGLESITEEGLSGYNKEFNRVSDYRRQLKAFADHGISVLASMVFMPGYGAPDQFRKACDFLIEARVPYAAWWNLTPLPATPFYRDLKAKGLLKRENWWLYKPGKYPDYKFCGPDMTQEDFRREYISSYRRFYSLSSILRRIPTHLKAGWWAEVLWNFGAFFVSRLRKDAMNLYSPLDHDKGLLSFLSWRFFGHGREQ